MIQDQERENFATKDDTNNIVLEIEKLRTETNERISKTNERIEKLRTETTERISKTNERIEKLRTETIERISETNVRIEKLRAEMSKLFRNQTIWLSGIMVTSVVTLISLVINN